MISTEQEKQIELFLISKKLSPSLLLEVKDHMISQILSLMETEKINFQEAFLKTIVSWNYEMQMVKADFFTFKKIARIEKELVQKNFNRIRINSLLFSCCSAVLYMVSDNLFFYFQIVFLAIFVLLLLTGFLFGKINFREYQRISFHPLILRNIILGLILFSLGWYFTKDYNFWEPVFNQMLIFYSLMVQIQLMYFKTKKINVLV